MHIKSVVLSAVYVAGVVCLCVPMALCASPPVPPESAAPAGSSTQPAGKSGGAGAAASQSRVYGKPLSTEIFPGEMIRYKSGNREIQAYLVKPKLPAGASKDLANLPAVIVVHDIFGMTPFIKAEAEKLARQGYTVMVPNLYSRLDKTENGLDAQTAWIDYDKTSDQQVTRDLAAAMDYLEGPPVEDQPPQRPIGVVGYDMGGIYAMMMAGADLRVGAAVNYYGRILYSSTTSMRPASPVESLFNLRAPLLNFYGTIDPQVPENQLREMESRLSHNLNKTFYEIVKYPGVGHSFMVPTRPGYNADAAKKSEEKTRLFLAEHLRAEPVKVE